MKKRIHIHFILIAFLAIAATWILAGAVFYELFQREVMEDLKSYSRLLQSTDALERMEQGAGAPRAENLRITLIGEDGQVRFDSDVDAPELENHGSRPEVAQAFRDGAGSSIRRSSTLRRSTFYYAVRTEGGSVLRVAKEAGSILSIFSSAVPEILFIAMLLFGLCMVLAHYLTRALVAPIERMADELGGTPQSSVYRELLPVVATIRQQNEAILKNARIRQEFTANVSHELKTPLTSISGYSELIESGMANAEDTIRFSREIHRSSKRLLTLINDIIRLSELDTLDQEIPFEEVDLYGLAQSCADMLRMNAENNGVVLHFTGEPCVIRADKGMMEELVYNLCDNAIRYNYEGGRVDMCVSHVPEGVLLAVRDTGIGIPKEHQERIFERFYRVDKSRSKSTGGTGLGLAIVKHIVARHGAALSLTSEAGKGTEISVLFHAQDKDTGDND